MNSNFFESFDIKSYVTKYIANKIIDIAVLGFKTALRRINKKKTVFKLEKFSKEDCIEFISKHLEENIKWATNISFRDASKAKKITDVFIELDLYISPLKLRVDPKEKTPKIPVSEFLSDTSRNIILLGQPGAGKTTSIKKLFLELINREYPDYEVFSFPILIKLKELEYNKENIKLLLFKEILNTVGVFYVFEGNVDENIKEKILLHIFSDFIERLDVLIILDGFDEISNEEIKTEVIRNLRLMSYSLRNSRFVLTSRSADYNIHIENSCEYEICSLNELQIKEFINKWLNNITQGESLLQQLKSSPYWDTTMRPLTLAHLCALFERNNSIPEKPKSVYRKIIQLLLEDWSNQRSIKRSSRYAKFEVDRKMDFLSRFAYELSVEFGRVSFNKSILELIYNTIYNDFDLPKGESHSVINELESHNGLILQTGTDKFEFAHKSLLEYLVADYLVKLTFPIRKAEILLAIPNELAIWIAISSNPGTTYFELILNILEKKCLQNEFLKPFLSRLIIEKPDFESNPLYAITNIYLANILAEQLQLFEGNRVSDNNKDISEKIEEFILEDEDFIEKDEFKEEDNIDDDVLNNEFYYSRDYLEVDNIEVSEEENDYFLYESSTDWKEYYLECLEILISFKNTSIFKNSFVELKNYYLFGEVELSKNNSKLLLKKWGRIVHLKRLKKSARVSSITIDLPDNLYFFV